MALLEPAAADRTLSDGRPGDAAETASGGVLGGRYLLGKVLGAGAMGTVHEATHARTGRRVAVKVLHPARATNDEQVARFEREARATTEIAHPNIVEVLDFDRDGDRTFLVLERLEGETLAERLERVGPLDPPEALGLLLPVLQALEAAHARGIVHRDLKPANVFLARTRDGGLCAKVLDFGLARMPNTRKLTGENVLLGSPAYMAPEQARSAGDLDGRADLWSFGALLYECLTGSLPYDGATIPELLVRSATQSPTPLRALRPEVPEALAAVIHRALERNRALRYPCARALREALERALAYPEDLSPRTLSVPPAARTTPLRRYLLAAAGALGLLVNTMPSRAMHTPSYNDAPSSFPPPAPLDRDPALRAFAQSPLRVRVRTPARRGSTPAPVRLCIGQ